MKGSYINLLIENQNAGVTPCEGLLGSSARVQRAANYWESNATALHLIGVNELLRFVKQDSPTPEEVAAFEKGLAAIPNALQACWEEQEAKKAQS
jgi:hypothetical protein